MQYVSLEKFYNFCREFLLAENCSNSRERGSCTEKLRCMSRLTELANLGTLFEYNATAVTIPLS